jgi:hypothetical protein
MPDSPLVVQSRPGVLGEEEVGGVVSVQVADLAAADLECELAPPPGPRLDAGSGKYKFK